MLNKILMGVVIVILIGAFLPGIINHTHSYSWEIVQPANCTESGLRSGKCSCGKKITEIVDAIGHTTGPFQDTAHPTCTVCGENYESKGLTFALTQDASACIVAGFGTCADKNIVIPSTWQDKPVVAIAENAFSNPNYILYQIAIPDTIKTIGESAFKNCAWLQRVVFIGQSTLTTIPRYAFGYNGFLESINIPATVTKIDHCAFYNCQKLNNVVLPSVLQYIGDFAFSQCNSLRTITIPSSVTHIGYGAFSPCDRLEKVIFQDSTGWKITDRDYNQVKIQLSTPQQNAILLTDPYSYGGCILDKK